MAAPLIAIPAYRLGPGRVSLWGEKPAVALPATVRRGRGARRRPPRPADVAGSRPAPSCWRRSTRCCWRAAATSIRPRTDRSSAPRCTAWTRTATAWRWTWCGRRSRQGKPALCVCRGMQVANVALGGTLRPAPAGRPRDGRARRAAGRRHGARRAGRRRQRAGEGARRRGGDGPRATTIRASTGSAKGWSRRGGAPTGWSRASSSRIPATGGCSGCSGIRRRRRPTIPRSRRCSARWSRKRPRAVAERGAVCTLLPFRKK